MIMDSNQYSDWLRDKRQVEPPKEQRQQISLDDYRKKCKAQGMRETVKELWNRS